MFGRSAVCIDGLASVTAPKRHRAQSPAQACAPATQRTCPQPVLSDSCASFHTHHKYRRVFCSYVLPAPTPVMVCCVCCPAVCGSLFSSFLGGGRSGEEVESLVVSARSRGAARRMEGCNRGQTSARRLTSTRGCAAVK